MKKQKKVNKELVHTYSFTKEELDKLRDIQAGIVISSSQLDGLQMFKNAILRGVYQRIGILGDPPKGFSKSIQFNLSENKIIHTETPIKEPDPPKVAKN